MLGLGSIKHELEISGLLNWEQVKASVQLEKSLSIPIKGYTWPLLSHGAYRSKIVELEKSLL